MQRLTNRVGKVAQRWSFREGRGHLVGNMLLTGSNGHQKHIAGDQRAADVD